MPGAKGTSHVPTTQLPRVSLTADAAYWDSQAPTFDNQPDHGLHDPRTREAWKQLLLPQLPPAPALILCGPLAELCSWCSPRVHPASTPPAVLRR